MFRDGCHTRSYRVVKGYGPVKGVRDERYLAFFVLGFAFVGGLVATVQSHRHTAKPHRL
jgi:hypothetical protein